MAAETTYPGTAPAHGMNFGLIGVGMIAEFHAEAIRDIDGARVAVVAGRSETKVKAFAERHHCDWVADYRDILKQPEVHVVCVTTSSGSHAAIGMDVLRAGKHLVIEKPVAMNTKDAAALIRLAHERKLTFSVISQRRFEPQHLAVKRALDEGGLGKLLLVEVSLPWFRTQEYYDSADWRGTIALDGGALMNQGIHSVDLMLWLAGPAATVIGKVATQTHRMEAEDIGLAIVQFQGGGLGTLMASTSIRPGFLAGINLYGEHGTVKIEGPSILHWTVPDRDRPTTPAPGGGGGVADPKAIVSTYHRLQLVDVIDSIATGKPPLVSGHDGLRAVQLVEAIYESSATGRQVPVVEFQL